MEKVYSNSSKVKCTFTEEGITFGGIEQEVFLPYGCIDSINLSLLGVLQATSHTRICSFAVNRGDRAEVRELVKQAKKAMLTAPKAEPQIIDLAAKEELVSSQLPPEEQLAKYKALFIQGVISKEEYDGRKRQLRQK